MNIPAKTIGAAVFLTLSLSGCVTGPAGGVATQVVASGLQSQATSARFIARFRGMDCNKINQEIAARERTFINPLAGDGGYMAAAKQVAAEKGC